MKKYLAVFLLLSSCATVPAGTLQLGHQIDEDRSLAQVGGQTINKGRPVFLEIQAYPQLLPSGDVWTGGRVLLSLGREDLSLDTLVAPGPAKEVTP